MGKLSKLRKWLKSDVLSVPDVDIESAQEIVAAAGELEASVSSLGDNELSTALREATDTAHQFAVIREAARRTIGLRAYDEQLLCAAVLLDEAVAEMQTGEGKTLAAVFCASVLALEGKGVHVLTTNDYLARRDAAWMGPVYRRLGRSVGRVQSDSQVWERKQAYSCDITYAPAIEAGFDFQRDRLALRPDQCVQRDCYAAIVDEADSILVDEARFPLVVAGGEDLGHDLVHLGDSAVRKLPPEAHRIDPDARTVYFSEEGLDLLEAMATEQQAPSPDESEGFRRLQLSLQAHVLLTRDVDYIVRDSRIVIVDELTGRVAPRRRWPDGLHAAVEAKEGVTLTTEARVLGQMTMQAYLRRYEHLCGMTGTAEGSEQEIARAYELGTAIIPTHKPSIRVDHPDAVFTHRDAKIAAVVTKISELHRSGRPVLVGTPSVAESEALASVLSGTDIAFNVLNARNDEQEAQIIAQAGQPGAVTISTNMAGRGTDIRLGGPDEANRETVVASGGLVVLGTSLHTSKRVDRQLRGRAGRQGDPGESQFFVALDDDLVLRYGLDEYVAEQIGEIEPSDTEVTDAVLLKIIQRSQRVVDWLNAQIRSNVGRYGDILDAQREHIHTWRQQILFDPAPTTVADIDPEASNAILERFGDRATGVERRIALDAIDTEWVEHLEHMRELRDRADFLTLGGDAGVSVYETTGAQAFAETLQHVEARIVELAAEAAEGQIPDDGAASRPTAQWTYLIADTPSRAARMSWLDVTWRMLRDQKD